MQPQLQERDPEEVKVYFAELYKLMWLMVWDYVNPERMRLQAEELFAELSAELVHVVAHYGDNGHTHEDIIRVAKTCMRNRLMDIYAMEYHTHRREESSNISLDECDGEELDRYESLYQIGSGFKLFEFLELLSVDGRALAELVLHPNDNLMTQLRLAVARKRAISPKRMWTIEPNKNILRRALAWDKQRFDNAWEEIKSVLGYA